MLLDIETSLVREIKWDTVMVGFAFKEFNFSCEHY